MLRWPSKRREVQALADRLLAAVISASRRPALYGAERAPDTLDGRFEMMTLHAALVLLRLRDEQVARGLAQRFTDVLFRHFDAGLREAGVGDLTVPKRMRALAGSFYGRVEAYAAAVAAGDAAALAAAIERNALGGAQVEFAGELARSVLGLAAAQSEQPYTALGEPWRAAID